MQPSEIREILTDLPDKALVLDARLQSRSIDWSTNNSDRDALPPCPLQFDINTLRSVTGTVACSGAQ